MRNLKRFATWRSASMVLAALLLITVTSACTMAYAKNGGNDELRIKSVAVRMDNMEKAVGLWPDPVLQNYPMREALVKYTERQDLLNHPYYIYILAFDGSPIGYYVGQTYPQSSCNFLGSTQQILPDYEGDPMVTAPSYDGIFYGGGGASNGCTSFFFFDAATDAMQVFSADTWLVSDAPISLYEDAPMLGGGQVPSQG